MRGACAEGSAGETAGTGSAVEVVAAGEEAREGAAAALGSGFEGAGAGAGVGFGISDGWSKNGAIGRCEYGCCVWSREAHQGEVQDQKEGLDETHRLAGFVV